MCSVLATGPGFSPWNCYTHAHKHTHKFSPSYNQDVSSTRAEGWDYSACGLFGIFKNLKLVMLIIVCLFPKCYNMIDIKYVNKVRVWVGELVTLVYFRFSEPCNSYMPIPNYFASQCKWILDECEISRKSFVSYFYILGNWGLQRLL